MQGLRCRFNSSRERRARRHLHPRPAAVAIVLPCTFTHELGLHGYGLHELHGSSAPMSCSGVWLWRRARAIRAASKLDRLLSSAFGELGHAWSSAMHGLLVAPLQGYSPGGVGAQPPYRELGLVVLSPSSAYW
ncbi:hypothetical protein Dimus_017614 [Dionaea muscipula]